MRVPSLVMAILLASALAATAPVAVSPAAAAQADIPILVPITGPLALEGTSQQNGALLALERGTRRRRG